MRCLGCRCVELNVPCRIGIFADGFLPKRIIRRIGRFPVHPNLLRIHHVVEVMLGR